MRQNTVNFLKRQLTNIMEQLDECKQQEPEDSDIIKYLTASIILLEDTIRCVEATTR